MPAVGVHAASNGRDFGTSRWLLCTTLHQLIIMWKSMESQKLGTFRTCQPRQPMSSFRDKAAVPQKSRDGRV
jgi:hypothetical protein